MNRITVAAACAVMLALPAACRSQEAKARPAPARSTEQRLLELEKERNDAMVRADVAALDKITGADFTAVTPTHVADKKEMLADIASGRLKYQSIEMSDVKVRVYGNAAVMTGSRRLVGEHDGRKLDGLDWFTRVYVKQDGRWQCVAFQSTPARE